MGQLKSGTRGYDQVGASDNFFEILPLVELRELIHPNDQEQMLIRGKRGQGVDRVTHARALELAAVDLDQLFVADDPAFDHGGALFRRGSLSLNAQRTDARGHGPDSVQPELLGDVDHAVKMAVVKRIEIAAEN